MVGAAYQLSMVSHIFIDLEWECAENSSGAPISIGACRSDNQESLYGKWSVSIKRCSDWTQLQVVPQLDLEKPCSAENAIHRLKEWQSQAINTSWWVGEKQAAMWMSRNYGIACKLWPETCTEDERILLWWRAQEWLEKYPCYHALWDARGVLDQWRALQHKNMVTYPYEYTNSRNNLGIATNDLIGCGESTQHD